MVVIHLLNCPQVCSNLLDLIHGVLEPLLIGFEKVLLVEHLLLNDSKFILSCAEFPHEFIKQSVIFPRNFVNILLDRGQVSVQPLVHLLNYIATAVGFLLRDHQSTLEIVDGGLGLSEGLLNFCLDLTNPIIVFCLHISPFLKFK